MLAVVSAVSSGQSATGIQNTTTDSAPAAAASSERGGFLSRFIEAYRQDWNGAEQQAELPRRIPPPPLNSPPFPSADWNYGGSSVIGAWAMTEYPLMEALYGGRNGSAWKNSRVQIYGWINPGFNLSTSQHSNLPEGYNIFPNRVDLDQAVIYVERVPDTVQTDHIDRGFRLGLLTTVLRQTTY